MIRYVIEVDDSEESISDGLAPLYLDDLLCLGWQRPVTGTWERVESQPSSEG